MKITKSYTPLFKGIDLTVRKLPLLIARSGKAGPTLWLTAAVHGNEVNGTAVIHEVFARLKKNSLKKGVVFSFPILNPSGFETASRYEQYEEEDINRHFDETDRGSTIAQRHAKTILSKILETKPDYVIDLHTDSLNSIAYSIVDIPSVLKNRNDVLKSITLAGMLNLPWAIDTEKNAGYKLNRCLTGRLVTLGIGAVTVELGGPLLINDRFKKIGVESVWQVMTKLGMVEGKTEKPDEKIPETVKIFDERIISENTGIVEYKVKPGETVKKGAILGLVKNIFGETIDTIKAKRKSVVFSYEDQSVAFEGQTLFTMAVDIKFNDIIYK